MDIIRSFIYRHPYYLLVAASAIAIAVSISFWIISRQLRVENSSTKQLNESCDDSNTHLSNAILSPSSKKAKRVEWLCNLTPEVEHLMTEDDSSLHEEEEEQLSLDQILKKVSLFSYLDNEEMMNELSTNAQEIASSNITPSMLSDGSIYVVGTTTDYITIETEIITSNSVDKIPQSFSQYQVLNSLLSVLCELVGHEPTHHHTARITSISTTTTSSSSDDIPLIKVPKSVLVKFLRDYPSEMYRIIQLILLKLERVTSRSLLYYFNIKVLSLHHLPSSLPPPPLINPNAFRNLKLDGSQEDVLECVIPIVCNSLLSSQKTLGDKKLESILWEGCSIVTYGPESLVQERHSGTKKDVFIILDGTVALYTDKNCRETQELVIGKGHTIGLTQAFTGDTSLLYASVRSSSATLLKIPLATTFHQMYVVSPKVLLSTLVTNVVSQFSPIALSLDRFFDWLHISSGQVLCAEGDKCEKVYYVLSGRVRSTSINSKICEEVGKDHTINAMQMVMNSTLETTTYAIRDTQLAAMPSVVFTYISNHFPRMLLHFTKVLANSSNTSSNNTSRTVAIISAFNTEQQGRVSVKKFSKSLKESLTKIVRSSVTRMSLHRASTYLNASEDDDSWSSRINEPKLSGWLGEVESVNDIVLYEGDKSHLWNTLCIRQADHVLLLVPSNITSTSTIEVHSDLERAWNLKNVETSVVKIRSSKNLRVNPEWFVEFLKTTEYVKRMHNVRCDSGGINTTDVDRIARRITNTSIGLVLGGGGARGLAHVGVIRALEEVGIPIDVVGGTSIGAYVGAVYAQYPNNVTKRQECITTLCNRMSSKWEKLMELTLPIVSWFSASRFSAFIRDSIGHGVNIEDLLLDYYCITTDIISSCVGVHKFGKTWKYVRASMSLQGFLPPVTDGPKSLLLDGGYMNIFPADVMNISEGVSTIIGVDVGKEVPRTNILDYGTSLSGWYVLFNRLNPFTKTVQVRSMGQLSASLAFVSAEQLKAHVRDKYVSLYLKPPVGSFTTLDFDKGDLISNLGYTYSLPLIKDWWNNNNAHFLNEKESTTSTSLQWKPLSKTVRRRHSLKSI